MVAATSADLEVPVDKEQLTSAPADPLIVDQQVRNVSEVAISKGQKWMNRNAAVEANEIGHFQVLRKCPISNWWAVKDSNLDPLIKSDPERTSTETQDDIKLKDLYTWD